MTLVETLRQCEAWTPLNITKKEEKSLKTPRNNQKSLNSMTNASWDLEFTFVAVNCDTSLGRNALEWSPIVCCYSWLSVFFSTEPRQSNCAKARSLEVSRPTQAQAMKLWSQSLRMPWTHSLILHKGSEKVVSLKFHKLFMIPWYSMTQQ